MALTKEEVLDKLIEYITKLIELEGYNEETNIQLSDIKEQYDFDGMRTTLEAKKVERRVDSVSLSAEITKLKKDIKDA